MAHQDTLSQLKQKFSSDEQWQEFVSFIKTQKIRGDARELWLQWEIHLLKFQVCKPQWHSQEGRFVRSDTVASYTLFQ